MNVECWARRSSFVKYIRHFSHNDSNVVPDQHCSSILAQHSIYRLKQYYTNVDGWARRSSFVKYIGNYSYNDLNVMPGQHCSSTLAQHSIYRLQQYYVNVDCWARRSSFVKYIGNFSYNDSNVVPGQHCRSTLAQHYVYIYIYMYMKVQKRSFPLWLGLQLSSGISSTCSSLTVKSELSGPWFSAVVESRDTISCWHIIVNIGRHSISIIPTE